MAFNSKFPGIMLTIFLTSCITINVPDAKVNLPMGAATEGENQALEEATSLPTLAMEATSEADAGMTTYSDEETGFALQYPADWYETASEQQSDGTVTQIQSWPSTEIVEEIPEDESVLKIEVLHWEPANDLNAYMQHWKDIWADSGNVILSKEEWNINRKRRAVLFTLQDPEGKQLFYFFTELRDDYLVLSGSGDLNTLVRIARSVRLKE